MLKAQQELETEGLKGEFDRTQATQTLETTLDKLLDQLQEKNTQEPAEGADSLQATRGRRNLAPKQPGWQQVFLTLVCFVSTSSSSPHHVLLTAASCCVSISCYQSNRPFPDVKSNLVSQNQL